MSNIKSPVAKWDYQSLYAIASNPKANKTIAHNTIVSVTYDPKTLEDNGVNVLLHGNIIAWLTPDNQVLLCPAAYEWCTYTTQTRLQKIMVDNKQDGIGRKQGEWVRYKINYE